MAESLMVALTNTAVQSINTAVNNAGNSGGITSISTVGATSTVPTSTSVSCDPTTQNIAAGSPAFLNAGNGASDANGNPPTYAWNAPGSSITSSTGYTFNGTYSTPGTYNVTVTASTDNTSATCQVIVGSTTPPVSCSPATQTVQLVAQSNGDPFSPTITYVANATTNASGGYNTGSTAPTYTWNAPGSTPSSATGSSLAETYNATGTYNITVTGSLDNTSSTCQVLVQ